MLSQPFPEHVCGCLVEGIICLLPGSYILCCVVSSLRLWQQPAGLLGGSLLALSALVLLVLLGLSKAACKAGMLQPRGHYSDFCVNETLVWRPASGRQDGIAGQPLARTELLRRFRGDAWSPLCMAIAVCPICMLQVLRRVLPWWRAGRVAPYGLQISLCQLQPLQTTAAPQHERRHPQSAWKYAS